MKIGRVIKLDQITRCWQVMQSGKDVFLFLFEGEEDVVSAVNYRRKRKQLVQAIKGWVSGALNARGDAEEARKRYLDMMVDSAVRVVAQGFGESESQLFLCDMLPWVKKRLWKRGRSLGA